MTNETMIGIAIGFGLVGLYLLPTSIASMRRHNHVGAVFVLNLFTGWTGWGWVAALVWAFVTPRRQP